MMNSKNLALIALSLLVQAVPSFAQDTRPKQPNIVFLMTDDQRWDMLGCYGRKDVITPNIDKLAEKGVVFDNAFYAVAICMPSRTTMFTGRYFSDHRGGFTYPYNRTIPKNEFAESYPAKLKEAGYRTGFVGKFNVRLEGNRGTVPEFFDYFVEGNAVVLPKDDPGLKEIYRKDRPANERTLKKGDAMIRFLETQPKDQPFCLSISFDAVKNDKDDDMYPPDVEVFKDMVMEIPENWVEGENEELPDVLDRCRGTYLHAKRTATPEQYQTTTRRFAVQGYTVDNQVGRLVAKLEEMGVMDNTIIIYTSDNGRFHGSHGLFDKALLYDESVKEPLIVFDGRSPESRRGVRVDAMVSSTDIAPTIVSLGGVEPPAAMKGKSLTGLLNGDQDMTKWRDTVLMENFFLQDMYTAQNKKVEDLEKVNQEIIAKNESYRTRGVRTERFKYFKYYEAIPPVEELYDLDKDPHEMNNLAANPEYAPVMADMRKRTADLYEEMKAQ
jgi:arylsulfatase A-like enzyme